MSMRTESSQSIGPTLDAIETSGPSTGATLNQLTLFAEAFPASPTPLLADEKRLKTTATSGPKSSDACAKLSPDGSWVKTSQGFSQARTDGSLEPFCETWPRAGSMSNGIAYRRAPLVLPTSATGYGLWPTPQAKDGQGYYVTSYRSAHNRKQSGRQLHWIHRALLIGGRDVKGWANPRFSEAMMGYPLGWTDCEDSATPSSPK